MTPNGYHKHIVNMPTLGTATFFMIAYIDESGDLGWTLDKPYRMGGSSQYLSIAILLTPNKSKHHPKRVVKGIYTKYKIAPSKEIKGVDLSENRLAFFVQEVINLRKIHPEIRIVAITCKKENVQKHIRNDSNKLYNYMIRLVLLREVIKENTVTLIPDPRSIRVKSGNSLIDYLQTELWFECGSSTILNHEIVHSDNSLNLKFIDIITHIIWCKYENKQSGNADLLMPYITHHELFF